MQIKLPSTSKTNKQTDKSTLCAAPGTHTYTHREAGTPLPCVCAVHRFSGVTDREARMGGAVRQETLRAGWTEHGTAHHSPREVSDSTSIFIPEGTTGRGTGSAWDRFKPCVRPEPGERVSRTTIGMTDCTTTTCTGICCSPCLLGTSSPSQVKRSETSDRRHTKWGWL
jgi:hypothetical protein